MGNNGVTLRLRLLSLNSLEKAKGPGEKENIVINCTSRERTFLNDPNRLIMETRGQGSLSSPC